MATNGGVRKGAGRKKGSVNKRSQELIDMIKKKYPRYDPIMAMIAIAKKKGVKDELKLQAHKEIAKYVRPQLRSIEVTGRDGEDLPPQVYILPDGTKVEF